MTNTVSGPVVLLVSSAVRGFGREKMRTDHRVETVVDDVIPYSRFA